MVRGSRTATALLASFLAASPALAEPRGPSDKDKQVAGDLVKKAIARSQAGDHAAAIEIYLQAYTIVPNSLLLSNIGAEFQQSGKPQEALRYFCMYLDKDPTGTNAVFATSQARSLQLQLGNKHVDDDDVCAKPEPRPRRTKEPSKEPARQPAREPDRDRLRDPEPAKQPADEDVPPSGNSTLRYAGLGAGLLAIVAVGVGTYDGIQAKNISDEITNHPQNTPWPDNIKELQKQGQRAENYQIGCLVAGGVLGAAGIILYMVGRPDESPRRSSDKTTVRVTPTATGFAVFGRF